MPTYTHAQLQPFLGTWELEPAQAQYEAGQPPKSGTYAIAFDGERLHFTVDWVTADDKPMHTAFSAIADGQEHPFENPAQADSTCYTLTDAHMLENTASKGGQVIATARRTLSEDGQTMTVTQSGKLPDGKPFSNVAVYVKRANA